MAEDDLSERQRDELDIIKAIYVTEATEKSQTSSNDRVLTLRLFPQRGSSSGAKQEYEPMSVDLLFKIPKDYPNVVPEAAIIQSKGLSAVETSELIAGISRKAASCVGEVMILELAQFVEEYLHSHRKENLGSFYDQMELERKQKLEEQNKQKLEEEAKKKLENQKRLEAHEANMRKMQEEWKSHNEVLSSSPSSQMVSQGSPTQTHDDMSIGMNMSRKRHSVSGSRRRRSTSEGSDASSFSGGNEIVPIEFTYGKFVRKFQRGELLGRNSNKGSKVYAALDNTTGSLVAITEWSFFFHTGKKNTKKVNDTNSPLELLMKQVHGFEQEFNLLQKLEHPNIVLYLGLKSVPDNSANIVLYMAQEFIRGTSLKPYLTGAISVDVAFVRHCAKGILQALDYLHSNNVVHRFLRETSVFLDSSGEVKLSDYGLERKICELYQTHLGGVPEDIIDKFSPTIGRGAKKNDIYRFGVIVLSLLKGDYESKNPPQIPSGLPEELKDFLRRCLTTNEQQRWTAAQLLQHGFLKMQLGGLAKYLRGEDGDDNEDDIKTGNVAPILNLPLTQGISRLQSEFEVMQWLGKGGFGDVMKVKNKLDGGVYALKRIRLNPRNKQLNKKITREVQLLSQLNHENVVRYFNSWIETVIDCESEETSSSMMMTPSTPAAPTPASVRLEKSVRFNLGNHHNSIGLIDNIEELAPPMKDADWSYSMCDGDLYESEDDLSEDDDIFGKQYGSESSEDVVFDCEMSSQSSVDDIGKSFTESRSEKEETVPTPDLDKREERGIMTEVQFMYIQMEFCEKSTLRTAIDDGLYQDMDRCWRLFRETVEGLVHIHQQGMIHRDLKPVNIFLDSYDHVKIGDFGLATTNILTKTSADVTILETVKANMQQSIDFPEESMTGHVGTALYVAPELMATAGTKVMYNQKVDIYSLGIILFEMFHHPLDTGMERYKVLLQLRQKDIVFPSDFDEQLLPQVVNLARRLLNHDPAQRPTSLELLQSDDMPPPLMEETALHDMFRHTLAKPTSKAYKYLINSCFQQKFSAAEDITFNYGLEKRLPNPQNEVFHHKIIQKARSIVQSVFFRHGAIEINTPQLALRSELYEPHKTAVNLMTHCGNVVSMPYDLRVPFARYVVWNNITSLKRFSIEKVFREKKIYGLHPTELYECALDIISTSKGTLINDAEVLAITFEVLNDLAWMRDKGLVIRLSHTHLLEAVFLHYSIDEKKSAEIRSFLASLKADRTSRAQVQTHLVSLCMSEPLTSMLLALIDVEGPMEKITDHSIFKTILKKKGAASSKAKEALHELEILIENLESFGLKCEILIQPALVFGTTMYTGLIFQVACNLRKHKNRQTVDVIAVGGRYDALIEKFRSTLEMYSLASKEVSQSGVGISISLDKLVAGLNREEGDVGSAVRTVDAVIYSMGHHTTSKEKIAIMKDLVAHGIHCSVLDDLSIDSIEEYSRQLGAQFIIILNEAEDIRIKTWEKDRFQEKRVHKGEIVEHIERNLKSSSDEHFGPSLSRVDSTILRGSNNVTESSTTLGNQATAYTSSTALNVTYITQGQDKEKTNTMRRRQNQILSHIENVLSKFSKGQIVEVIVTDIGSAVINCLTKLQIHDKEDYHKSVAEIMEEHPKHKKIVERICDDVYTVVFDKAKFATVIILYAYHENYFRVLM